MPITPDTKDWTWVLDRACDECGYDASSIDPTQVATLVRENAAIWPTVLARPDVRQRPSDDTWSPLEYAAHVRDVLRITRGRLALMLEQDDPRYANWDQDETAVAQRYNEQNPTAINHELGDAAADLAADFDAVDAPQWSRTGRRSDGATFTVATFALYVLHDVVHHRWDVRG